MRLPPTYAFDLPVSVADLFGHPLTIARDALNRMYNAMGQRNAPHFDDAGEPVPMFAGQISSSLLASLRAS